ncbi:MAG: dienelactone hydrolase family protein [Actinomycetota bacterium]
MPDGADHERRSPLDALDTMAVQEVEIAPGLRHLEIYTLTGLLSFWCHGPPDASSVVLACGGAMGGALGPADGVYHHVGSELAERGIATIRVGYRRPNDLAHCAHDLLAAADYASRTGGDRFVTVGHSFGGAVAVQAAVALEERAAGVVTLSTQSAGCEEGEVLEGKVPVLLLHGDRDRILPAAASEMVRFLIGGELHVLAGADHLLVEAADEVRRHLLDWIPARFESVA